MNASRKKPTQPVMCTENACRSSTTVFAISGEVDLLLETVDRPMRNCSQAALQNMFNAEGGKATRSSVALEDAKR